MLNYPIHKEYDERHWVDVMYPEGVDTCIWLIGVTNKDNKYWRRLYIDTGYHVFWADEIHKDINNNKYLQKFYSLDNLVKNMIPILQSKYNIQQRA